MFLQEFEHEVMQPSNSAHAITLKDLPPQNFTPITSGTHVKLHHSDIRELIDNLRSLIEECAFTATLFNQMLTEDSNTSHSLLTHFINLLQTPICQCHPSASKLSIYYHDGLSALILPLFYLPDSLMLFNTDNQQKTYLKELRNLNINVRQTGSALGLTCSRLLLFLNEIDKGLKPNTLQTTLRLASTSFTQIESILEGLKATSHALIALATALKI
ncbi:hypothetical protein AQS70_16575 [Pseudomonas endophytica]|uniref:Uncharacterized protein n=1 Tax=Pseudomonas endophytica TaxID=1563157 RepID=A0A0Q0YSC8_9PSED|nr:hypothetical protein [Pseudomonas endophytica]KQB51912.1 hypothetical protein AQS70_16575 [Pseudomonas endophytica]